MTPLYLSRPSLWLPEAVLTNEDVLDRVRLRYRGEEDAWPLLEAGRVKPVIHTVLPAIDAARAHALMESNQHIGKIVLQW